MNQAVIVAAKRTAFGKYGGTLKHLEPEQLLKPLFQHFKEKYPEVISKIDDVVLGLLGMVAILQEKHCLKRGLKIQYLASQSIGNVGLDLKVFNMHVA
ncbi:acetyl-CoA acetyltransferase [Staphylococcus aureus]|nr:acetyl-CoA acetyltransferase [Staphylococcus aureus]